MMKAIERLYLTEDRAALVREGDPRGAFLYVAPGDDIPDSAVERFGLADGTIAEGGAKERRGREDKERREGEDKGGGGGQGGATKEPDPKLLTSIKGIGKGTAARLVAAGIADVPALAAVDPAAHPTIKGMPPAFDWAAVIGLAKAALSPVEPVTEPVVEAA